MAGVGFELQKFLRRDTYTNVLRAYTYAGVLSAGPWIISIVAILLIGMLEVVQIQLHVEVSRFQLATVYLIATSLIFSSFAQQNFSRFVADCIYYKRFDRILPNYLGMLAIMTFFSGIVAFPISLMLFHDQSLLFRILMPATFVVLCNIWFSACLISGLKNYRLILMAFLAGYGVTVILGYMLRFHGLDGLLLGFFIGQFLLLIGMIIPLFLQYLPSTLIEFDFLEKKEMFYSFIAAGAFYNLAVWVDKFIFWFSPLTGHLIFAHLHAAIIYDIPMFLAYVAMIPGMAVFLLYIETDFVEYYNKYYMAIREGHTFSDILDWRFHMIAAARRGVWAMIRLQALVILIVFILGGKILQFFHLSPLYRHLLNIDVVATSILVLLISMLNVFSYLDKRLTVVWITFSFFALNVIFTVLSQFLGPYYYGYGFAAAIFVSTIAAFIVLDRNYRYLETQTFMQ